MVQKINKKMDALEAKRDKMHQAEVDYAMRKQKLSLADHTVIEEGENSVFSANGLAGSRELKTLRA